MSNLVVTILAITLAGAIGLAGMFYGGGGYLDGQARTKATKYTNYLTQLSGSVNLWSQRNGGTMPRPSASYPGACSNSAYCSVSDLQTLVGTRYLGDVQIPEGADGTMAYYWNESSSFMENPILLIRMPSGSSSERTCYASETLRQGTAPTALRTFSANINAAACGDVGCFENDGTFGNAAAYPYVIYHRLGATPDTDATDYPGPTCPASGTEDPPGPTPSPPSPPAPDPTPPAPDPTPPAPDPTPPAPDPTPPPPSPPAPDPTPSPPAPSPTPGPEPEEEEAEEGSPSPAPAPATPPAATAASWAPRTSRPSPSRAPARSRSPIPR
nr:hypothetical protein [Alphaproteobacteria bacterium]